MILDLVFCKTSTEKLLLLLFLQAEGCKTSSSKSSEVLVHYTPTIYWWDIYLESLRHSRPKDSERFYNSEANSFGSDNKTLWPICLFSRAKHLITCYLNAKASPNKEKSHVFSTRHCIIITYSCFIIPMLVIV